MVCPARLVMMSLFVAFSPVPALATCSSAVATITGTLSERKTRHPNGQPLQGFVIKTLRPISVVTSANKGCVTAAAVHIIPKEQGDVAFLKSRLGQVISVTSDDVFEAHTAWHLGEAVALRVEVRR